MIRIELKITTTQEEFKECIAAAMQKRFNEETPLSQIKDFEIDDKVIFSDVQNMLLGSCLGELIKSEIKVSMIRSY